MKTFNLSDIDLTKYLFFTGKGGVGKTSIACATAVGLADNGKKILLISTDPASNLQDVFNQTLNGHGTDIQEVPGLTVVNLDPEQAAAEYRESVIAPFRGQLPESVIQNMEEQLSGSCTVEIAAFNQFSDFITDANKAKEYDHIIFDTAPTGHTLRMLQLPSAWSTFISESTHGASCLGQLSGLEERKGIYKQAVETLSDANATRLVLVSRPEIAPLREAARSSHELQLLGIKNQLLVINGLLLQLDEADSVSKQIYDRQQNALKQTPAELLAYPSYYVPLRSYNLSNIANIRRMLHDDNLTNDANYQRITDAKGLDELVNDLYQSGKRVVFTMGKGGVGKTTLATEIALKLTKLGAKVHLTTTDPANHLNYNLAVQAGITVSRIDEAEVLEAYKNEVRSKAAETMTAEDMEYIEEDLRSPCTQEIAVFRAFAEIVDKAENEVVVIDTAPTGHTLLLLDATESYHKEVQRTHGDTPASVRKLLPRLRNQQETEVVIVTLPEATPVFEAERLQMDLQRAGINNKWWVVNACLSLTDTENSFLRAKAQNELIWIKKVEELSKGNVALIGLEKCINEKNMNVKELVKLKYGEIALQNQNSSCCSSGCGCSSGEVYTIMNEDYTQLDGYNADADMGLGCGLPTQFANLEKGDTVVDLGSGAGNDCFIARQEVGDLGQVIGIDFTPEMIAKARKNAQKRGFTNIEFREGDIENMPVDNNSVNVVVSNCVLNLLPQKDKVFHEIFRVLKPGGHFCISDIVLNGELPKALSEAVEMYVGCIAGAITQEEYLNEITKAGFQQIEIVKKKNIIIPDEILAKYKNDASIKEADLKQFEIYSITVRGKK